MCEKELSLERDINSLSFHSTSCPLSFPEIFLAPGQFFLASLRGMTAFVPPSTPQNQTEAGVVLFAFCWVAISTELNHFARGEGSLLTLRK